jgi:hypothetical protein
LRGTILELNQHKKVSGRTYVRWVIHEIHPSDEVFNKNGISWIENHVQSNIESAKNMPLCVEFTDSWDKDEPWGHGMSDIKDGSPLFEYSVVVGVTENAYIDTIEVNGESKRVLVGEGYIYNQRYPKFVQWLKSKMFDDDFPETSVEISAKEGNDVIIYENGWKEEGRVPSVYDYSGDAILGIEPADDSAVFLELNNKFDKEDKKMAKENEQVILELNNKIDDKNTEINGLKDQVKVKDGEVVELNSKLDTKSTELNSTVEELKEVNTKLEEKTKEFDTMTSEVNELREYKKEVENEKLKSEMNSKLTQYTDEEKESVKEKVEKFNAEPSKKLMDEIVSEINSSIAQKIVEHRKNKQKLETNSNKADDIYSDVYEINNENEDGIEDLY